MSLFRYYVDLRCYSFKEQELYRSKLEKYAFIYTPFLDKIGLIEVFWDLPEPLYQVIGIPKDLVSDVLPE